MLPKQTPSRAPRCRVSIPEAKATKQKRYSISKVSSGLFAHCGGLHKLKTNSIRMCSPLSSIPLGGRRILCAVIVGVSVLTISMLFRHHRLKHRRRLFEDFDELFQQALDSAQDQIQSRIPAAFWAKEYFVMADLTEETKVRLFDKYKECLDNKAKLGPRFTPADNIRLAFHAVRKEMLTQKEIRIDDKEHLYKDPADGQCHFKPKFKDMYVKMYDLEEDESIDSICGLDDDEFYVSKYRYGPEMLQEIRTTGFYGSKRDGRGKTDDGFVNVYTDYYLGKTTKQYGLAKDDHYYFAVGFGFLTRDFGKRLSRWTRREDSSEIVSPYQNWAIFHQDALIPYGTFRIPRDVFEKFVCVKHRYRKCPSECKWTASE